MNEAMKPESSRLEAVCWLALRLRRADWFRRTWEGLFALEKLKFALSRPPNSRISMPISAHLRSNLACFAAKATTRLLLHFAEDPVPIHPLPCLTSHSLSCYRLTWAHQIPSMSMNPRTPPCLIIRYRHYCSLPLIAQRIG